MHHSFCCAGLYGGTPIYAYDHTIYLDGTKLVAPFNVVCISNGLVGLSDGNRTYFYTVQGTVLKPLGISTRGVITSCSYSGRFLAYVSLEGVELVDLNLNSDYFFAGAVDAKTFIDGFIIIYLNKVLSWVNGSKSVVRTHGVVEDATLLSNKLAVCEDGNKVLVYRNGVLFNKKLKCWRLERVGNKLLDLVGDKYLILDTSSLDVLGKGKIACKPKDVESSGDKVLILCDDSLYLYKLLELKRSDVYFLLTVIAIISLLISLVLKLKREWLSEY